MTNNSRYLGYYNNINREYLTDGNDSHRAPSDHTVSEYIVATDHATMVMCNLYLKLYILLLICQLL